MDFRQLMKAVWADSLDGIVIADAQTVIVDVNPAYCHLTGYSREELIGRKTNIVRSNLTPPDVFRDMWGKLTTRGKWVGELINRRPDGSLWYSYLSITRVLGPDGQVAAYVGIARDVTAWRNLELRLTQQSTRLGALLEAIESGVAMFDREDRLVLANTNLARLLGRTMAELTDKSRRELQEELAAFFAEEAVFFPETPAGRRIVSSREPRPRYFILRWAPVAPSGGEVLGQIFTLRDVTRETEVDRMKSEFIATVSHELRTPLTSVKGALGLLLGGAAGPVDAAQQELLSIAQTNVDRLIRLVSDILDLSRIDAGRLELRRSAVDLNQVVLEAVRELESVRQQRQLRLECDLADGLPRIYADPDRIGQVLVNLLGNAYKFTDPGGWVAVCTRLAGREVQVAVADSGPGIPRDQLQSIFERFYRAPGAASRRAGGTGLGLAIAKAIVEQHGGRIWAESDVGKGAVFTFALPVEESIAPFPPLAAERP